MGYDTQTAELVGAEQFFAPIPHAPVGDLVAQHAAARAKIEAVALMLDQGGDFSDIVGYFISGNVKDGGYSRIACERVFRLDGALAALHAFYWQRALDLTDVYECMPAPRREQWSESIRKHTTPPFNADNVRATLEELLLARGKFLAERVDGIFQKLSRNHVTNAPEGFGRRMILEYVFNTWGHTDSDRAAYINDLRAVIAKFMGREAPQHYATRSDLDVFRFRTGVWHGLDGGALRIRVYKKGTAHLEVHPDMAWRLNCILHTLYPAAIPSSFREPPKKRAREWAAPILRPLPFEVLKVLQQRRPASSSRQMIELPYASGASTHVLAEVYRTLLALGGTRYDPMNNQVWQFDYDPTEALVELCASGCIPDAKSHQFYPTPPEIAQRVVELAEIEDHHTVLEPSAGVGSIAARANHASPHGVTAVEIAPLFVKVLQGLPLARVISGDFLEHVERGNLPTFDRIVMNPPFEKGQAEAHVRAALKLLAPGGRLVAVLPSSHRNKDFGRIDFNPRWHDTYDDAFPGASVSVSLLTVERDA